MDVGAYVACSASQANQKLLETITHNLANASTPGFKKMLRFMETKQIAGAGGGVPQSFIDVTPIILDKKQGDLHLTDGKLDFAIQGEGNFVIDTPQGPRTTRDGRFKLDPEGRIVSLGGFPLQGEKGDITLDETGDVQVLLNGEVHVNKKMVDRLSIVDEKLGPVDETKYEVWQGYMEASNVNPIEEMVRIMELMRSYQSYTKMVDGFDKVEQKTLTEMGRV